MHDRIRQPLDDLAPLLARLGVTPLFIIFGRQKLIDFSATVGYMQHLNLPLPTLAAGIAVLMELVVGLALLAGLWTRPLALLLAVYTLATAFIGHAFWEMVGPERYAGEINFLKNFGIAGGLVLLASTGAGRYALDARRARRG